MTESKPPVISPAAQHHPLIEEARLARLHAEEAVQRVQRRIERLAHLSQASDRIRDDDEGRERSAQDSKPAPGVRRSD
jgi:hypothetical protein